MPTEPNDHIVMGTESSSYTRELVRCTMCATQSSVVSSSNPATSDGVHSNTREEPSGLVRPLMKIRRRRGPIVRPVLCVLLTGLGLTSSTWGEVERYGDQLGVLGFWHPP